MKIHMRLDSLEFKNHLQRLYRDEYGVELPEDTYRYIVKKLTEKAMKGPTKRINEITGEADVVH